MKQTKFWLLPVVLVLLVTIPLSGMGCQKCTDEYKLLTVEKGIAHFSLEYPCEWGVGLIETTVDFTTTSISGPTVKIDDSHVPSATFSIWIDWPSADIPDAMAAQEDWLAFLEKGYIYELLGESTVEIGGVQAKQAVVHSYIGTDFVRIKEPIPTTEKLIDFDYGGLIWEIYYTSALAVAEENEAYFQHLLETFKILE